MSNRAIVGDPDKMAQWMRDMEDRVTALQTRKLQGALQMDSAALGGATIDAATIANLTVTGALNFPAPLGAINDIQTGFANTGAGIAALTTSFQDLPNTARTFVPIGKNALVHVTASFDMNGATTGWTQIFGCMNVNGVDNGIVAIKQDDGTANNRSTHPMTHVFAVPTTGLTLTMRARKTAAGGTASIPGTISIWTWVFIDKD